MDTQTLSVPVQHYAMFFIIIIANFYIYRILNHFYSFIYIFCVLFIFYLYKIGIFLLLYL